MQLQYKIDRNIVRLAQEDRLRDASFELSAIPTFQIRVEPGPTFRMIAVNQALEHLTGLKAGEMEGRTPHEFLPSRTADTVVANYLRCVETRESYAYDEVLDLPKGEQWYRTVLTPQAGPDGRIYRLMGQATNITDLMVDNIENTRALADLTRSNEDFSRLLPLLAHDFRGPVGQVRTAINMILDGFVDLGDGKRQMLAASEITLERLLDQFERLLSYCSALSVDRPKRHRPINFGHLCRDIIALVDPGAQLDIRFPPGAVFDGDPAMVQIIVRNLTANAVVHAKRVVSLDVQCDDQTVSLVIEDDGPGFSDSIRETLTSSRPALDTAAGNGFGLAAVRHLVDRAGGRIDFDRSARLGGAAVTIVLPIAET